MRKLLNDELGRLSVREFKSADKTPLIIVLDDIRSLNNIGSVFRTADAFRLEKIILCGITAKPLHKEIHKTALGATETVAWEYVSDISECITKLRDQQVMVLAVEQVENSVKLQDFYPSTGKTYALIFGNEVFGVSDEAVKAADAALEIPQLGTKHSLNISVSAGIVVWDIFTKMYYHDPRS